MNITQILILYIKKTQKNLAFFLQLSDVSHCLLTSVVLFAQVDQLQVAHLTWSGRGWWAQERRRGGTISYLSTGRTDGYDCSSPCEERTLQVWDGPVFHAPPLPCVGSAPGWQPQSDFFLRWEWCPVAACHALGTLLHCQGTHGSATTVAFTTRTRCLVSPNCCATMVAKDPCQSNFWHPPLYGQCHHN